MANAGGHAYTIPAQDCYSNNMGGPSDGVGSALTSDAADCYVAGQATQVAPPTGLNAVVN